MRALMDEEGGPQNTQAKIFSCTSSVDWIINTLLLNVFRMRFTFSSLKSYYDLCRKKCARYESNQIPQKSRLATAIATSH